MRAIIFGINSQDGYYLKEILIHNNVEIIGVSRSLGNWNQGSVANFSLVEQLIKTHKPDFVFHLAANSSTSHDKLFENHETISTGSLNILEAVYKHSRHTKVFLSGSAVQFENKGLPVNEATPFAALSPYAVARIQSVYAARYFRNCGLKVYVGYFFHHDSPLRSEKHVNQKIVKAIFRIDNGSKEKIEIGNLDVRKEFNFAGDMMNGVWSVVNNDIFFEVVLGCGKAYSLREWVDYCFKLSNKNWRNFVVVKNKFIPDFQILVSAPSKLYSLGWKPEVDFYKLAELMVHAN